MPPETPEFVSQKQAIDLRSILGWVAEITVAVVGINLTSPFTLPAQAQTPPISGVETGGGVNGTIVELPINNNVNVQEFDASIGFIISSNGDRTIGAVNFRRDNDQATITVLIRDNTQTLGIITEGTVMLSQDEEHGNNFVGQATIGDVTYNFTITEADLQWLVESWEEVDNYFNDLDESNNKDSLSTLLTNQEIEEAMSI
jgi:hypothetical protein